MFTPVKECSLDCPDIVWIMSQTSDKEKREQTGSIWSNFHMEKRKGTRRESRRWRKRCRDRLGLCLLLLCWITPTFEDWTHNNCSSRCSVMGQWQREIWKMEAGERGNVFVREMEGKRWSKWGDWRASDLCWTGVDLNWCDGGNFFRVVSGLSVFQCFFYILYVHIATLSVFPSKPDFKQHFYISIAGFFT